MKLETTRLYLKPVEIADCEEIYQMFTTDWVKQFLFDGEKISRDQVRAFIDESIQTFSQREYGLWILYTKDSASLIGFVGLRCFFDEPQPQLLYALLPGYTKQGYAAEAAAKVVDFAMRTLQFAYLEATCDTPNIESHKVAVAIGMKNVKEEIIDGKPVSFFRIEGDTPSQTAISNSYGAPEPGSTRKTRKIAMPALTTITQEIAAAEERLRLAMLASDDQVLDELISPDLIFTNHFGQVFQKQDDLQLHRSRILRFRTLEPSEERINAGPGLSVVSVRMKVSGTYGKAEFTADLRYTRIWRIAPNGAWQIVAGHSSMVA